MDTVHIEVVSSTEFKNEKNKKDPERTFESLQNECEEWRQKVFERVKKFQARGRNIPNILVVGAPGVGKSSFINSIAAAISGEWHEYAYSGRNENQDEPLSIFLRKHVKLCLEEEEDFKEMPLPNLLDLSGFDQGDDVVEEVIRCLCYGWIPEGEAITKVRKLGVGEGVKAIQEKYTESHTNLLVDRVVVVCAANEPVPTKLLECIRSAARPREAGEGIYRKAIPVHGVMTKHDQLQTKEEKSDYKERESKFISALSMEGARHRFAMCNNYCDDTAPDKTTQSHPELDLDILKFLYHLLDPAAKVENPNDNPRAAAKDKKKGMDVASQGGGQMFMGLDLSSRLIWMGLLILLIAVWIVFWHFGLPGALSVLLMFVGSFLLLHNRK